MLVLVSPNVLNWINFVKQRCRPLVILLELSNISFRQDYRGLSHLAVNASIVLQQCNYCRSYLSDRLLPSPVLCLLYLCGIPMCYYYVTIHSYLLFPFVLKSSREAGRWEITQSFFVY